MSCMEEMIVYNAWNSHFDPIFTRARFAGAAIGSVEVMHANVSGSLQEPMHGL
ncbi:MAG: hypothetical protein P1U84_14220 [Parvibaculaceae bacterium]|nr:hypothetical protein [Parvibaculaceae bacterium]